MTLPVFCLRRLNMNVLGTSGHAASSRNCFVTSTDVRWPSASTATTSMTYGFGQQPTEFFVATSPPFRPSAASDGTVTVATTTDGRAHSVWFGTDAVSAGMTTSAYSIHQQVRATMPNYCGCSSRWLASVPLLSNGPCPSPAIFAIRRRYPWLDRTVRQPLPTTSISPLIDVETPTTLLCRSSSATDCHAGGRSTDHASQPDTSSTIPMSGRVMLVELHAKRRTGATHSNAHRAPAVPLRRVLADVQPGRSLADAHPHAHRREAVRLRDVWSGVRSWGRAQQASAGSFQGAAEAAELTAVVGEMRLHSSVQEQQHVFLRL
jgi:hypothetical protein